MKAEALMTRSVSTCSPDDNLASAARAMWECDVGCLVVLGTDLSPVGVITDRDIAMAAYIQGKALSELLVSHAMSKRLLVCTADTPLSELEEMMQREQIRRVPVVDSESRLLGIVTLADIARSTQSNTFRVTEAPGLARTLAAITERRMPAEMRLAAA